MTRISSLFRSLYSNGRRHPRKSIVAIGVLVVALFFVFTGGNELEAPTENTTSTPTVELVSIAALSEETEPIVVVGEVRSASQADLRFERGGQVTSVYAQPGQFVRAGAVLAEVENAQERAALLSAQGTLAAAEAQLAKVRAGARAEDRASVAAQTAGSATARITAQTNAQNAYTAAYTTAYSAIYTQADTFFKNSYTVRPTFTVNTATYDERMALEKERVALTGVLDAWHNDTKVPLKTDTLDTKLAQAQDTLVRVQAFITSIGAYVSEQEVNEYLSASEKAAQEGTVSTAQQSLDGAKASIAGARGGLAQAQTSALVAEESERAIEAGARPEDIAAAEAGVTQARGAYASAQAALSETRLITPIAGTVSSLSVLRGDLVPTQQTVAVVANENTREVEVYVSDAVRERISEGTQVLIKGMHRGVVRNVAPGLDPATKKARVIISVTDDTELVQGAYVEIAFLPDEALSTVTPAPQDTSLYVPLTAIKVTPNGLAVFTVGDDRTLRAVPIAEGPIVGARMRVGSELTGDTRIVRDVRGLSEGDVVSLTDNASNAQ